MPTVAELDVVISADVRQFDAGIKHVEQATKGLGDSVAKGAGIGLGFGAVAKGLEIVGGAFGTVKSAAIDLNSSLEQSKIAFTTMLGSAEKADAFLADLAKFAAETPFEFPDLVQASKRMFAFGFESKQVVPLLTAVGDAVAAVGGGADVIDGVTTALGQMQAKGKVSAEEMNQLAERGIPAWDMLAKKLGVSVAQAMDMASKGTVKAATFIEAFQQGTAQRFGGMMAKQARTWQGALSTISDSVNMSIAVAFRPLFDIMSTGAIMLADFLTGDTFKEWSGIVADAIGDVITSTIALARAIGTELQPVFAWVMDHGAEIKAVFLGAAAGIGTLLASAAVVPIISAVGGALMALLSPIALVAAAGATLALAWQGNWFNIQVYVNNFLTWLTTVAVPTLTATLGAAITYLTTTVVPLFQAALAALTLWMQTIFVPTLTVVWDWFSTKIGGAVTWLTETGWPLLGAAMNAVQNWLSETLAPTLESVWEWLSEKLGDALTWLRDKGWPAFGDAMNAVQNWIKESLLPILEKVWDWLARQFSAALNWLTDTGWPLFKGAMEAVWSWINEALVPTLSIVWEWLKLRFGEALTWLTDTGWPNLQTAMSNTSTYITTTLIPSFTDLHAKLAEKGVYDDIAASATNIWQALKQINQYLPTTSKGFSDAVQPAYDFANGVKAITAAFREWSETGPYDIVDAFNEAVFMIRHTIWEGMNAIADAASWVADAAGVALPDIFGHMPSEPERPSPVQRPSGGGGGGGGSSPAPNPPGQGSMPGPGGGGGSAPSPSPSPSPSPAPVEPPRVPTPEPTPAPSPSPAYPTTPSGWAAAARAAAESLGIPSDTFAKQMSHESVGFAENVIWQRMLSPAGARGIAQFMTGTGNSIADQMGVSRDAFWSDPYLQLRGGAFLMKQNLASYDQDMLAALVAYNAGNVNADYLRPYLHNPTREVYELENTWRDKEPRQYIRSILGYAQGGWAGLNGPEVAMLGERGPEYIVPNSALRRSGGSLSEQTVRIDVAIGGRLAEEIYVTGRDLAIRRGRAPAGAV